MADEHVTRLVQRRPYLGILVPESYLHGIQHQGPLDKANLYAAAAIQEGITAYYFSLEGVDGRKRRIRGWLQVDGQWGEQDLPWPDVLYVQRREPTKSEAVAIYRLLRQGTPAINTDVMLAKWRCHTVLSRYPDTRILLPHTVRHRGSKQVWMMLKQHSAVFVKPDTGSRGRGVCRAWRDGNRYGLQFSGSNTPVLGLSFRRLYRKVIRFSGRNVVIQQEIPLLTIGESKADIRVLMQKNLRGQWVPYSFRIRIAEPGSIVSNAHQGAQVADLVDELHKLVNDAGTVRALMEQVRQTAELVVRRLDAGLGPMGEVGVDLAFDQQFRLWIIEANARPDKDQSTDLGYVPEKFTRTMQYAKYLYRAE